MLYKAFLYLKEVNRNQKRILQNFELEDDEIVLKDSRFLTEFFRERNLENLQDALDGE